MKLKITTEIEFSRGGFATRHTDTAQLLQRLLLEGTA